MTDSFRPPYGEGDGTLQAVGGLSGLQTLVETFYRLMAATPEYRPLFEMHPKNLPLTIEKLVAFLSGWMGGERLFSQKFGPISLPQAHAHLVITEKEKAMWLNCMEAALIELGYQEDLRAYLLTKLEFPAERIHQVSAARHGHSD